MLKTTLLISAKGQENAESFSFFAIFRYTAINIWLSGVNTKQAPLTIPNRNEKQTQKTISPSRKDHLPEFEMPSPQVRNATYTNQKDAKSNKNAKFFHSKKTNLPISNSIFGQIANKNNAIHLTLKQAILIVFLIS